ncbi:MAG: hypothetical protein JWO10_2220 [Microbacteriaceae bacterium]|nr:hypothetical protein [Microbacteriaceae bacterium]
MEHLIAWAERAGLSPAADQEGDIVHLSDSTVAISMGTRQGIYAVEVSVAGMPRLVLGAFDNVDDASRLFVMQVGALVRERQRMPRLTAHVLPPGFVIEPTPTALWLSWFTGSAEFPVGERARRRAVEFSRAERASVDEIESSYLEPAGGPLFEVA